MRGSAIAAVAAFVLTTSGSIAHAQTLGANFSTVRQAYADAQLVRIGDARALELREVDYAGFHWKTVDFVFNSAGRLDHLTMSTDAASYEEVLKAASVARMQEPPSVSTAAAPGGPDLQVRVCEGRSGGVTVTYEAVSVLS